MRERPSRPFRKLPAALVALFLLGGVPDRSGAAEGSEPFGHQVIRNVAYYDGPGAHPTRHRLDLYLPKGAKGFPVLVWIHGGAWVKGDKNHFGVFGLFARVFTRHGIAVVCPNYRLSPEVKHPGHVRDVARAFAWTHKNIAKYGGRPDEIFVGGHSAGGHLSALLACDETYLRAENLSLQDVRGVLPLSGLFIIPNDSVFDLAFGKDRSIRKQASPITHARPGLPPFLVTYADSELPGCGAPGATAFCKALTGKECCADYFEVPRRNHVSILLHATRDTDPVAQAMLAFINANVTLHRLQNEGAAGVEALQTFVTRYVLANGTKTGS